MLADLVSVSVPAVAVGTVAVELGEVTAVPAGFRAVTVAVLTTPPASTSAWVITYGALVVQVVVAPGASVVVGQVVVPTFASTTASPVSVTAPVFVARKAYATRSPASVRPFAFTSVGVPADFVRVRVAAVDVGVAVEEAFEVTVAPAGLRPVTRAVLATVPASTSAWVTTYGAVVAQLVVAPGARLVVVQVVAPTSGSTTARPVIVCAPVFVTANV
ncbi:hypothetical protein GCM10009593_29230 [Microlunatus antarcticus]